MHNPMKIINEMPPQALMDRIFGAGMHPSERTLYTYGDTLYVPSGNPVPDDLMVHEETHMEQQGLTPEAWWDRYLIDPYFRLQQEVEAYGNQYAYLCAVHRDRNYRMRILIDLARILSGPVYGQMIPHSEAMKMIKSKANVN